MLLWCDCRIVVNCLIDIVDHDCCIIVLNYLEMPAICKYVITYAIAYFAKTCISHIFLHIMAFSKSRGNCRMCKNLHICRMFLHMQSHFVSRLIFFCIVFVDFANLIVKQHVCLQLSTCLSATHLLYIAVMSHVAYQLVCCLVN